MRYVFHKLQIKLLSPRGELINCVNCYAGQVSVFRAHATADLLPYQRAFAGVPSAEQMIIQLDGESFGPDRHILIGFGEQFLNTDGKVGSFLLRAGVPEASVEALLISFGLESAFHTACSLLSKCEERRVRILAAMYCDDKIVVLNNPFDPIAAEWRERFADLVVTTARSRKRIVVVTSLSYRPECWIDNDSVARIQVGDTIQKTIGFASPEGEMQDLVRQVRKDVSSGAFGVSSAVDSCQGRLEASGNSFSDQEVEEEYPPAEWPAEQHSAGRRLGAAVSGMFLSAWASFPKTHRVRLCIAGGVLLIGTFASVRMLSRVDSGESDVATATSAQEFPPHSVAPLFPEIPSREEMEAAPVPVSATNGDTLPDPVHPLEAAKLNQPSPGTALLLDEYPESVRVAVKAAFEGTVSRGSNRISDSYEAPKPLSEAGSHRFTGKEAGDFLKLLESASGSGEASPDLDGPSAPVTIEGDSPSSEQERREQIRQKFLEAIQRAQQRRNELE